jgi:hypothetical protein
LQPVEEVIKVIEVIGETLLKKKNVIEEDLKCYRVENNVWNILPLCLTLGQKE